MVKNFDLPEAKLLEGIGWDVVHHRAAIEFYRRTHAGRFCPVNFYIRSSIVMSNYYPKKRKPEVNLGERKGHRGTQAPRLGRLIV